jgi:hypothetical protein
MVEKDPKNPFGEHCKTSKKKQITQKKRTGHIMAIKGNGFIPTKTIVFAGSMFPSCTIRQYPADGWHPVHADALCLGDINEGADLYSFLLEAAGDDGKVDETSLLRVKVQGDMVTAVYAPGIMGGDKSLWLVSGDNKYELEFNVVAKTFKVGNITGRLIEKIYQTSDESTSVFVSIAFTPNNPAVKVIYEVPLIKKRREVIAEILGDDNITVSKELIEHLLETVGATPQEKAGVQAVSDLLLQVLGSTNNRKKLHILGENSFWYVRDYAKIKQPENAKFPPNWELWLQDANGVDMEGSYTTNKDLTNCFNKLGDVFKGRRLILLVGDIRPYNSHFTVKASIQMIDEHRRPETLRSAAVPPQRAISGSGSPSPELAVEAPAELKADFTDMPF